MIHAGSKADCNSSPRAFELGARWPKNRPKKPFKFYKHLNKRKSVCVRYINTFLNVNESKHKSNSTNRKYVGCTRGINIYRSTEPGIIFPVLKHYAFPAKSYRLLSCLCWVNKPKFNVKRKSLEIMKIWLVSLIVFIVAHCFVFLRVSVQFYFI